MIFLRSLIFQMILFSVSSTALRAQNPVIIMDTEFGTIEFELYPEKAPGTVSNFLSYIENDMWKGASFYRVVTTDNQPDNDIKIEVIQGGLGWSDSLQRLDPIVHETTRSSGILHKDGTLSMARGKPGTAASEFFICIGDQPSLDYGGMRNPDGEGFAAFGSVIRGMEVVGEIQKLPEKGQMLINPVLIKSIYRQ